MQTNKKIREEIIRNDGDTEIVITTFQQAATGLYYDLKSKRLIRSPSP